MATIWQQLGGWVQNGGNLSDATLDRFRDIGGRWIVVLLRGDEYVAGPNHDLLPDLKRRAKERDLRVGGWFNLFGEDPGEAAINIAGFIHQYALSPNMLDCEDAYQGAGADRLPLLLKEIRQLVPVGTYPIGVSPKAVDDSMIWNGRGVSPVRSCYDLKIRVCPQWYSGQYLKNLNQGPAQQMQKLRAEGATNLNFYSASGPGGRGLPTSFVHPVWEATGLEGSDLGDELRRSREAQDFGFTKGGSIYNLENTPDSDFALLSAQRGILYL